MKIEMETAIGGKVEEKEIPVMRLSAGNGELREVLSRRWPGWKVILALCKWLLLAGLFFYCGPLIRLFDPGAGVIGGDVLSVMLAALVIVDGFALMAWLVLGMLRERITAAYAGQEETEGMDKNERSCLEAKICSFTYGGLLLLFVFVFIVLL